MRPSLSADILQLLADRGVVDVTRNGVVVGSTGWHGYKDYLPSNNVEYHAGDARRDQAVVVTASGGARRNAIEIPTLRILARGAPYDRDGTERKMLEILDVLYPNDLPLGQFTVNGTTYAWVRARQSRPMFLGFDSQNWRPDWSQNYDIGI